MKADRMHAALEIAPLMGNHINGNEGKFFGIKIGKNL